MSDLKQGNIYVDSYTHNLVRLMDAFAYGKNDPYALVDIIYSWRRKRVMNVISTDTHRSNLEELNIEYLEERINEYDRIIDSVFAVVFCVAICHS